MSRFIWDRALNLENKITCWDIVLSQEEFDKYQKDGFVRKEEDLYLLDHPNYPISIIHINKNMSEVFL